MRNPFFHRQAVTDPAQVFGRAGRARELFEMIGSGQSCAVVGERRIGKSTLLTYLASPSVQASHGLDPDTTLTAMLDFLALHGLSPGELWPEIVEALALDAVDAEVRSTLEEATDAPELRFAEFRRLVRRLHRRGHRIVLLCDELDLAIHNPLFDETFFGALRSLAGEGLVFVTASRASLLELEQYRSEEAKRKVLASPFFNIFAEYSLGPFGDADVAEWLAASLEPTPIRFDARDIQWLDAQGGRHPFFLQLAAYHLFGELERSGLGRIAHPRPEASGTASDRAEQREACRREAATRVREEGAKVFRHQWVHGRDDERAALATLARLTSPRGATGSGSGSFITLPDVDPRLLRRLEQRGLLVREGGEGRREGGRYRVFSEPFLEWLRVRPSVVEGEGSVGGPASHPSKAPGSAAVDSTIWDAGPAPERYQLLEELGQGGTATVWKAWDRQLERLVALKRLDAELRASPARLAALVAEARACAGLSHPHVVVVHDIDAERGFLVEEHLPGGSLRDLFEQTAILGSVDRRGLAEELAEALAAAHEAGVLHGDLKPENILLTERPDPRSSSSVRRLPPIKLTDFGSAVRLEGSDAARGGTLAYMAPEQLAGQSISPAADIFAFGVVLYEAAHGHRPDEDATTLVADAPFADLDALVLRCLAPDPAARFADGRELLVAVRALGEA